MTGILKSNDNKVSQTKVIQSIPVWLPLTQTWIYNQIKYLPDYIKSAIVCGEKNNIEHFQLPNIHVIKDNSILQNYSRSNFKASSQRARLLWLLWNCFRFKPDIIHSHFGPNAWNDSFVVRWVKSKHVVTFYGYDVNMVPKHNKSWKNRYLSLFQSADLFLCEGPHMAECIRKLGCSRKKIRVHHLGVEVSKIKFKPRVMHPGEKLKILIVASFREKKGIPYALESVGRLNKRIDFEITIIGDATTEERALQEKKRIYDTIDKYNLNSKINMIGFQPHSVVMKHAYKNHIFLSPSITAKDGDTEGGAPVTIIEMMATGMPVISTRHCDIPEIISHGKTGLISNEKKIDELTDNLHWLVQNPDKWKFMVTSGLEKVKREFDVKVQGERMGEFYKNISSSPLFKK